MGSWCSSTCSLAQLNPQIMGAGRWPEPHKLPTHSLTCLPSQTYQSGWSCGQVGKWWSSFNQPTDHIDLGGGRGTGRQSSSNLPLKYKQRWLVSLTFKGAAGAGGAQNATLPLCCHLGSCGRLDPPQSGTPLKPLFLCGNLYENLFPHHAAAICFWREAAIGAKTFSCP